MTFVAGTKLRASELNRLGACVARNRRTTNSAAITTIQRVLSVRAPVVNGRTYRVIAHGEVFGLSGATTTQNELRHTTNDTEPTTTSTVLARALVRHDSTGGVPDSVTIVGEFNATATGFLRVALCCTRVAGAVTVSWAADPTFPTTLVVEDLGLTVAVSGTVY
jgi:hypothetical protein